MNGGAGGHATFLKVVAFPDNGWGGEKSNIKPYRCTNCSNKLQEWLDRRSVWNTDISRKINVYLRLKLIGADWRIKCPRVARVYIAWNHICECFVNMIIQDDNYKGAFHISGVVWRSCFSKHVQNCRWSFWVLIDHTLHMRAEGRLLNFVAISILINKRFIHHSSTFCCSALRLHFPLAHWGGC